MRAGFYGGATPITPADLSLGRASRPPPRPVASKTTKSQYPPSFGAIGPADHRLGSAATRVDSGSYRQSVLQGLGSTRGQADPLI